MGFGDRAARRRVLKQARNGGSQRVLRLSPQAYAKEFGDPAEMRGVRVDKGVGRPPRFLSSIKGGEDDAPELTAEWFEGATVLRPEGD